MQMLRVGMFIIAVFAISSLTDPYLGLQQPLLSHAVNALVFYTVSLVILFLTGRILVSLSILTALALVLRYAEKTKFGLLSTNIVYADFTIIPGLLSEPDLVLGFLEPSLMSLAIGLGAAVVLGGFWWIGKRERRIGGLTRWACLAAGVLAVVSVGTMKAPRKIDALSWRDFHQSKGAKSVGVAGNILLGRMTAHDVKRPANSKLAAEFWNEPLVRQAAAGIAREGNALRPDIVVIQSESLFEPSQLCGMSDTPVLQNLAAEKPSPPGNLKVPVFGGRTLQSEFEMITGTPVSHYPGSMFAYYELLDRPVNAFPASSGASATRAS